MKICVFGGGAIGGHLTVELALAGKEVCVVVRGEHLQAIQAPGQTLRTGGLEKRTSVVASDDPPRFGPQDYVFRTLKSRQAHAAASPFIPLLGSQTAVVTAIKAFHRGISIKNAASSKGDSLRRSIRKDVNGNPANPRGTPPDNAAFLVCVVQGLNVLTKTKPSRQKMELIVSNSVSSLGAQTGLHSPAD